MHVTHAEKIFLLDDKFILYLSFLTSHTRSPSILATDSVLATIIVNFYEVKITVI